MHYTNCNIYGIFGRFGSLEYIGQPRAEAPKYDAIQRWIEGRETPPLGNGSFNRRGYPGSFSNAIDDLDRQPSGGDTQIRVVWCGE